MSNKRTFLIGLGSGIIIGALLLQLFVMGETSQDRLNEIGRQLENEPLENGTATETPDQAATSVPNGGAPSEAAPTATPQSTAAPAASPTAATEQKPAPTAAAAKGNLRLIHIEKGMKLVQTGDLLVANEIIDDSAAFVKQMQASDERAKAGYFVIPKGAGIEAAVKAVTSTPLSKYAAEKMIADQK